MVDTNSVSDIVRLINLVLGSVTLTWLITRRIKHPEWYYGQIIRNDMWFLAMFWSLALVVGSIEQAFNTGTDTRTGFAFAAIFVTLRMLLRPIEAWPALIKEDTHGRSTLRGHRSTG